MLGGGMSQFKGMITLPMVQCKILLAIQLVAFVFTLWTGPGQAAEGIKFKGVYVKPYNSTYVVIKDVNIRSLPKTKSKRLGKYKSGRRIQVVGVAGGSWLAVREKGSDVGFVYKLFLLPVINGTLDKALTGVASSERKPATDCKYTISFEGKSPVEGQSFEIADYDIVWECIRAKKKIMFRTPMFITETPYKLTHKRTFQITVDVLDQDRGYDEIFSTFILFDLEKSRVFYDGVSIKKYAYVSAAKEFSAKSIAQALKGAAVIALKTWNKMAWEKLIKNMPKYSDPLPRKLITKKN